MKQELIKIREQLIYIIWETSKSEITMRDLAGIFSMSLGNIHRAISKWKNRDRDEFHLALQVLVKVYDVVKVISP